MNNNQRGIRSTSDKQSYKNSAIGTRHSSISTPNNNIHININLNLKKKSQCIHQTNPSGKKINNFIELNNPKNLHSNSQIPQQHSKNSQQLHKTTALGKNKFIATNKKPQTDKKLQKTKKKKTKQKEKTNSKPYTPEKIQKPSSQQKSFEKTKTGKKLIKKKQSKSMQNLKIFKEKNTQQSRKVLDLISHYKQNNLKHKSNQSSKQRSREKSASKLIKNRSSSKNITPFQNSGIKKILTSQKQTKSKNEGLQQQRKSKKSLKPGKHTQKDIIKINEFMEQKRKNDDKRKKQAEFLSKSVKNKSDLLKQTKPKRQFFSKPQYKQQKSLKNTKHPIYYGDEEQNNQQDSRLLHIQRNQNFSYHKTPQKSRPQSMKVSPQGHKKSAAKIRIKQPLFERYKNGRLTSKQYAKLISQIVKIQSFWRGFSTRKKLLQQINKLNRITSEKKKLINEKKSEFWDDEDNNSITNLQDQFRNHKEIRKNQKQTNFLNGTGFSFRTPQGSNYNSSSGVTDQIHTNNKKYESQSGNQFDKLQSQHENTLKIQDFRKNITVLQKQKQELKLMKQNRAQKRNQVQQDSANNIFLISQIQFLKKQLEEQNKKFTQLQKENTQLKQNLNSVKIQKKQNLINDLEEDQIQMYDLKFNKIENNHIKKVIKQYGEKDQKKVSQNKFKNLKIQTQQEAEKPEYIEENSKNNEKNADKKHIKDQNQIDLQKIGLKSPSSAYMETLKKELSSFESPSNRQLKSAQLSGLGNLQRAFKKKELSLQLTYEKNSVMYQQMLANNVVSPRTYNFKKIELDEKYKRQKEEINNKFKQAEKVMKYISEDVVLQEKAGEDESPKKERILNVDKMGKDSKDQQMNNRDGTKIKEAESVNLSEQSAFAMSQYESQVVDKIPVNKNHKFRQDKQKQHFKSPQVGISNQNTTTDNNFRKYWTEDIQEVHQKVLQISKKIDEALQGDQQKSLTNSDEEKCQEKLNSQINERNEYQVKKQKNKQMKPHGQKDDMKNQFQEKNEQVMANISSHSHKSDRSGRSLQSYNIHYPSSPSNSQKSNSKLKFNENHKINNLSQKHNFQIKNQHFYDDQQSQELSADGNNSQVSAQGNNSQASGQANNTQPSVEGNNSQLSQNRSSLSQSDSIMSQSTVKHKQNKGFDTRLTFIKQYCIALCQFIRSQEDLKLNFIENISTPLKYDYFEYLKSYRTTIKFEHDTKYNSTVQDYFYPYFKLIKGSIIPKALNQENTIKFDQLYDQSYGINKQLSPQIFEIRKFFLQAIIDVFNESLDFQRPGSVYGEPLPWFVQSKNLKNNHVKYLKEPQQLKNSLKNQDSSNEENQEDERLDKIFGIAIAKIIQWGSCLCGFIPEPVSFDGEQAQTVNIDEEQTNLVRETRLAYMLQKSLTEDEQKMVDNTMQQLQVQLQLQQIVFEEVISEFINDFRLMRLGSS